MCVKATHAFFADGLNISRFQCHSESMARSNGGDESLEFTLGQTQMMACRWQYVPVELGFLPPEGEFLEQKYILIFFLNPCGQR